MLATAADAILSIVFVNSAKLVRIWPPDAFQLRADSNYYKVYGRTVSTLWSRFCVCVPPDLLTDLLGNNSTWFTVGTRQTQSTDCCAFNTVQKVLLGVSKGSLPFVLQLLLQIRPMSTHLSVKVMCNVCMRQAVDTDHFKFKVYSKVWVLNLSKAACNCLTWLWRSERTTNDATRCPVCDKVLRCVITVLAVYLVFLSCCQGSVLWPQQRSAQPLHG